MFQRRAWVAIGLASSIVVGCYGDFDTFAQRRARLDCVRIKKCNGDFFQNEYDGEPAKCREAREDALQAVDAAAELLGWEYQPEEGRLCLEAAHNKRRACGSEAAQDIADACDEVWK